MSDSDFAIDTNAAIALMAGDPRLSSKLGPDARLFLPVTVLGELYFGAEKSGRPVENLKRIEEFCGYVNLIANDQETARHFGRVMNSLRAAGKPIPQNDMWIAASALQHNLTLATRDSHFENVKGLSVIRW